MSRRNSAESLMGTTAPEHFADLFLGELYEWETYMHTYIVVNLGTFDHTDPTNSKRDTRTLCA